MRPKDMTPEQFKAYASASGKRWRRKNHAYKQDYNAAWYRGTHRMWWTLACRKAGVNI